MALRARRTAAFLVATAVGAVAFGDAEPLSAGQGFVGPTLKHPAVPPDFALRDQNGRLLRLSGQRGKVVLVTFLYTHCPDLCPMTAANINTALRSLGTGGKRVVVFSLSVDPAGDTPRSVKAFVREHGLLPQFHYLTGSISTMRPIWRAYQVQAVRPAGPNVDHTLYTLLIDRSGRGRVLFDAQAKASAIAHDSRLLLG